MTPNNPYLLVFMQFCNFLLLEYELDFLNHFKQTEHSRNDGMSLLRLGESLGFLSKGHFPVLSCSIALGEANFHVVRCPMEGSLSKERKEVSSQEPALNWILPITMPLSLELDLFLSDVFICNHSPSYELRYNLRSDFDPEATSKIALRSLTLRNCEK